jgi:RNA polymerase sigma-70 factor (ECF subfamily)
MHADLLMETVLPDELDCLLEAVAAGDRVAFKRLYHGSAAQLYAVALRLLRRRDRAEEALQDAYVVIWRHAHRFDRRKGSPLAWMTAIVRYRAFDLLRRERARPEQALDEAQVEPAGEHMAWSGMAADLRALRACMETLAEPWRRCIQLAFLDGYTHEELAARLGAPLGTIKSWIRRGLMRLKGCLAQ